MAETETTRVVGIDLGTTNSLVAFMQGDQPQVIPGEDGSRLVPSVVAMPAGGKERVIVGNRAGSHLLTNPDRAVYSVKRLMGRGVDDVTEELKLFPFRIAEGSQQVIQLELGDRKLSPPQISAEILKQLKRNA